MSLQGVRMNSVAQFKSPAGGGLLVDKPPEWTSFDVVKKVRNSFRVKKVGHAGTLDPLATGLLVLLSNACTKLIDHVQVQEKTYEGTCVLGGITDSYDAATTVHDLRSFGHCTTESILSAMRSFVGDIEQVPPMYSAVKHDGERLYKLARRGEEVERKSRPVHVERFELLSSELPQLHFRVVCSKGTYVRTLVHDLGQMLGTGAYLSSLRRTAIGDFSVDDAVTIEQIIRATQEAKTEMQACSL